MNSFCCKPAMTAVAGVRAAALGSRSLSIWQRQCKAMMIGSKGSLLPLSLRPEMRHLHGPEEARLLRGIQHRPSLLLTLQCSGRDPFPLAITVELLNTKEYADGSIMFKFGSSDQQVIAADNASKQSSKEVAESASTSQLDVNDSNNLHASVNGNSQDSLTGAEGEVTANVQNKEKLSGIRIADAETTVRDSRIASDIDDVPDASTLSDMAHDAEELVQESYDEEDHLKAEQSSSSNDQLLSQSPNEVEVDSNDASTLSPTSGSSSSGSSGPGMKDEKPEEGFSFNSAAAMIPHPDKVKTGGEDAYFIEGTRWVGIADGVGGWALKGVDAGHYSRELMWNCAERAREVEGTSDPKSVLVYAAKRTRARGTATALLASLHDKTLRVTNIGDSGFLLVRDAAVVVRSNPLTRGFNFPYQIGTEGDDPEMASVYDVHAQKEDVLILATDGILDNVFEGQIVAIVSAVRKAGGGPEVVANELVRLAQKIGATTQGMSPFAVAAHAAGYSKFVGGKPDDTTAVVAYVA